MKAISYDGSLTIPTAITSNLFINLLSVASLTTSSALVISLAILIRLIDLPAETFEISFFQSIFESIPLAHSGFVWLMPVLFISTLSIFVQKRKAVVV